MPEETILRLHAVVHGRVQGVNFRSYTFRKAVELALSGWVRNVPDGTVEMVAEGERERLTNFLAFLHVGSPSATVTHVESDWLEATGEFREFLVRYDPW